MTRAKDDRVVWLASSALNASPDGSATNLSVAFVESVEFVIDSLTLL